MENALQAKQGARVRIHSEKKPEKIRILVSDDAGGIPRIKERPCFLRNEAKRNKALGWVLP